MNARSPCYWQALTFVAVCLVVLLMGGCGQKKEAPPPPAPAAPAPAPAPAKPSILPLPAPGPTAPQGPASAVDRILETMNWGNIAFNAPQSIQLKDTAQIQLLLSLEQSVEDLRNAITAAGENEGARIRISNRMEARLTGPSFQITAITPEQQAITSKGVTEWKWEIKPTTAGRHRLHLTLSALFSVDGASAQRAIRTFDKTIEVQVTLAQQASEFLSNNWQWIWAAVLVPVVAWLWKRAKARKSGNPSPLDT